MHEGREFGPQPDLDEEEVGLTNVAEKKENPELADIVQTLKTDSFAHVHADPDNSEMLKQLISDANEFADGETVGEWKKLLSDTSVNLMNEDDAMVIQDILREALSEASMLLDK